VPVLTALASVEDLQKRLQIENERADKLHHELTKVKSLLASAKKENERITKHNTRAVADFEGEVRRLKEVCVRVTIVIQL
jgi:predicted  nucleic acid-binding Zn-ribbon protein